MRSPRVIIHGGYGYGNLGDDVLFQVIADMFNSEEHRDTVRFSSWVQSSYVRRLNPYAQFLKPWSRIRQEDLLVFGGGTQHYSFPLTGSRSPWGKLARVGRDPQRALGVAIARFRKRQMKYPTRVAAIGIGLGPFSSESAESKARELVLRADYLWVRDERSFRQASKWGARKVELSPDLAFLYHPRKPLEQRWQKSGRIAFVPRDWPHTLEGAAHLKPMLVAAKMLRRYGCDPQFLLFKGKGDKFCYDEIRRAGEKVWCWTPQTQAIDDAFSFLAHFDVVVSARYHGVVLSAIANVAPIAANIEPKLAGCKEAFGGTVPLWDPPFDSDELVSMVLNILDGRVDRVAISQCVERHRVAAEGARCRFMTWLKTAFA